MQFLITFHPRARQSLNSSAYRRQVSRDPAIAPPTKALPSERSCRIMQRELASRLGHALRCCEDLFTQARDFNVENRQKYFASLRNLRLARDLTIADFEQLRRTRGHSWRELYYQLDSAIEGLRQRCTTASQRMGEAA